MNYIHILETIFKILPYSLYISSFIFSLLFQDMRGILLVSGGGLNSLINYLINRFLGSSDNIDHSVISDYCKDIFLIGENFNFSDHFMQTLGYIFTFFLLTQYKISNIKFLAILCIICVFAISIFLRLKCSKYNQILIGILFGCLIAVIYYNIIKDYFKESQGILTQEESLECEEI